MIQLIKLNEVALVISVNCNILSINYSYHFSLSTNRCDEENIVFFLKLQFELNKLSIVEHLVDFDIASISCVSLSCDIQVAEGSLI